MTAHPPRHDPHPTVIFIHGAGGGGWEWRIWRAVFESRGWHALTPDLQPAATGLAATTVEDYASQVEACAAALPSPPVLVGASMGGLLILKAVERVAAAALVLVNGIPPAGVRGWPAVARTFPDVVPWSNLSLAATRNSLPDADEETVRWVHGKWRDESGQVMRTLQAGAAVTPPRLPTLAIAGMQDRDVPPDVSLKLAQTVSADLMCFDGVSHMGALLGRRASTIADIACDWLDTILR